MSDNVTASLASIYKRKDVLPRVIESIYDQVDKLCVYLNDYPEIPGFLNDSKIEVHKSTPLGDLGDVGKFYPIMKQDGYLFTIDDDIFYPANYIEFLSERIDFYNRKSFVCVHGNLLPKQKIHSYYREKKGLHFARQLINECYVDVPGTGTLGFHSSLYTFSMENFPTPNMSDIWLYCLCQAMKYSIVCVARPEKWLQSAMLGIDDDSIYAKTHKNDFFQTDVINSVRGY